MLIDFGIPRTATILSNSTATLSPLRAVSARSVRHSRVSLIEDSQNTDPTTIRKTLSNKTHAPFFVPAHGFPLRQALTPCLLLTPRCSHLQSHLSIQAVDPLRVYFPSLALQQDRQAPVAVSYPAAGKLPQTPPQYLMALLMMLVTEGHARNRNQPRCMALALVPRLTSEERQQILATDAQLLLAPLVSPRRRSQIDHALHLLHEPRCCVVAHV